MACASCGEPLPTFGSRWWPLWDSGSRQSVSRRVLSLACLQRYARGLWFWQHIHVGATRYRMSFFLTFSRIHWSRVSRAHIGALGRLLTSSSFGRGIRICGPRVVGGCHLKLRHRPLQVGQPTRSHSRTARRAGGRQAGGSSWYGTLRHRRRRTLPTWTLSLGSSFEPW
jgi:hypothetical protein